jgi:hypothetical protein
VYDEASVSRSVVSAVLDVLPSRRPPALAAAVGCCPKPPPPADGPALGIDPMCGVEAVAKEYAAGAVSPDSRATTATVVATRRGR